jgi:chromosomal replication initiator protein
VSQTVEEHRSAYNPAFLRRIDARRRAEAIATELRVRREAEEERERKLAEMAARAAELKRQEAEAVRKRADEIARLNEEVDRRREAELELQKQLEAKKQRGFYARLERAAIRVFKVDRYELLSSARTLELVNARQFICYWARRRTDYSLVRIGRNLGDRDHTTVIHGHRAYVEKRKAMGRTLRKLS